MSDWPGIGQFIRLERHTIVKGKPRSSISYAVTSLKPEAVSADQLLRLLRSRWEIENRLFWVKDVVMGEDHARARSGNVPLATSVVRNAVVNFLRVTGAKKLATELRANVLQLNALFAKLRLPNL